MTSIGECAFLYCSGLTSVITEIIEPFSIKDVFSSYTYNSATLYVPKGTKEKYKATPAWNRFKTILEISEVTPIQGDVNGDLVVDVADISSVIDVMAKGDNDAAADVNGDGIVDVADISSIISVMAGR